MQILTSQLPSGGYGYDFPSVSVSPLNFLQITKYLENMPQTSDPLEKYLYDFKMLVDEDEKVLDLYIMDIDFLIFYKKLCTISEDLSYNVKVKCPDCGKLIEKRVTLTEDIHFKQVDPKIMEGATVELGGSTFETRVPTGREFNKVFEIYLKYRKVTDLKLIKTISLFKDFDIRANEIEKCVLEAKHSDITLLLALQELYFDQVEPVTLKCPDCNKKKNKKAKEEERRGVVAVSVDSLIVDFFRDLCDNSPIDGSKILFK